MDFNAYLEKRPVLDNDSGAFIKMAREDSALAGCKTIAELTALMTTKQLSLETITAGKRVFRSYQDYVSRRYKAPAEVVTAH